MLFSFRAIVFVKVIDVDDFSPKFEKMSLFANLREGKIYDSLVKVQAIDQDQSQQFGKICSYEVITPGVPFTVDNEGKNPTIGMKKNLSVGGDVKHIMT